MALYRPTWKDQKTGETKRSRVWWYAYVRDGKKVRINLKVKDRGAAKVREAQIDARRASGKPAAKAFVDALRARPADLIDAYESHLCADGASRTHMATTVARLRRMFAGVERLAHMDDERIKATLARIASEPCAGKDGLKRTGPPSTKTRNAYRTALSGFFTFLVKTGQAEENPVKRVPVEKTKRSAVRKRRAASFDELAALLQAAPPARRIVYLLACSAGLRRSELKRLLARHVNLTEGVLELTSDMTKNGEEGRIPLLPEALEGLKAILEGAGPEDPVFLRRSTRASKARKAARSGVPGVRTFYADLALASVPSEVGGRILDFHGLRASLATGLERTGVSPVVKKALMRHSLKRDLTDHYTKVDLTDARAAVASFGEALRSARARLGPKLGPVSSPLTDLIGLNGPDAGVDEEPENDKTERYQRSALLELQGSRGGRDSNPQPPDRQSEVGPREVRAPGHDMVRNLVQIRGPEDIARELLALAATATDPAPLIEAATALLAQAKPGNVVRLPERRSGGAS